MRYTFGNWNGTVIIYKNSSKRFWYAKIIHKSVKSSLNIVLFYRDSYEINVDNEG